MMNKKCAELSYTSEDKKVVFSELNQDMDIEEFHQHCRELAAAVGYHYSNITEWFDPDEDYPEIVNNLQRKITSLEVSLRKRVDQIDELEALVDTSDDAIIELKKRIGVLQPKADDYDNAISGMYS